MTVTSLKVCEDEREIEAWLSDKREGTSRKGETDGDEDREGLFEGGRSLGALNEEEELGWPKVYLFFFISSCDEENMKVLVSGVLMFFLSPEKEIRCKTLKKRYETIL